MDRLERTLGKLHGLYEDLGTCHPKLARGQVWCRSCGSTQKVNSAEAFRSGWPKCCGATMTIDAPDERPSNQQEGEG